MPYTSPRERQNPAGGFPTRSESTAARGRAIRQKLAWRAAAPDLDLLAGPEVGDRLG